MRARVCVRVCVCACACVRVLGLCASPALTMRLLSMPGSAFPQPATARLALCGKSPLPQLVSPSPFTASAHPQLVDVRPALCSVVSVSVSVSVSVTVSVPVTVTVRVEWVQAHVAPDNREHEVAMTEMLVVAKAQVCAPPSAP